PTSGDQPHFIAVPHRPDRSMDQPSFGICLRHNRGDRSRAQIKSIQHYVAGDHETGKYEPQRLHGYSRRPTRIASTNGTSADSRTGPCSTSLQIKYKKSIPSTK